MFFILFISSSRNKNDIRSFSSSYSYLVPREYLSSANDKKYFTHQIVETLVSATISRIKADNFLDLKTEEFCKLITDIYELKNDNKVISSELEELHRFIENNYTWEIECITSEKIVNRVENLDINQLNFLPKQMIEQIKFEVSLQNQEKKIHKTQEKQIKDKGVDLDI